MKHPRFVVLTLCLFVAVTFAYEVPSIAPKPLKETQDPAQVQAHAEAAKRMAESDASPVVPVDWVKQIQDLVQKDSHRESTPVEHCTFILKKDGTLAHIDMVIPTNATAHRTMRTKTTTYVQYSSTR
jgi:hypothetical protein